MKLSPSYAILIFCSVSLMVYMYTIKTATLTTVSVMLINTTDVQAAAAEHQLGKPYVGFT